MQVQRIMTFETLKTQKNQTQQTPYTDKINNNQIVKRNESFGMHPTPKLSRILNKLSTMRTNVGQVRPITKQVDGWLISLERRYRDPQESLHPYISVRATKSHNGEFLEVGYEYGDNPQWSYSVDDVLSGGGDGYTAIIRKDDLRFPSFYNLAEMLKPEILAAS